MTGAHPFGPYGSGPYEEDGTAAGSGTGSGRPPRTPESRPAARDADRRPAAPPPVLEHRVLESLLGAWALAACSPEETAAVEDHLGDCGACADEALRLRGAVGLLHPPESLDLDPALRTRVLETCLGRRPPRIPVPAWAGPYDAETARLDQLLQDIGDVEWHAPVRLRWFDGKAPVSRRTTVAGVLTHLLTVDGLVAVALGLDDPLTAPADTPSPAARTEAFWGAARFPPTRSVRGPWREQSHNLVRTVAFAGGGSGLLPVPYGDFELPLRDSMLDRAFETWVHAGDIADAVDYPYEPPAPRHLHAMIDLGARLLPAALAARRRAGLADPAPAHSPSRCLRLEIEGLGGGEWLIPLDGTTAPVAPAVSAGPSGPSGPAAPAAPAASDEEVAHVALDGVEFCQLAAGHVPPEEAAAGQLGDREAIRDVLFAAASLSRM